MNFIVNVTNPYSLRTDYLLQRYISCEELNTFSERQKNGLLHILFQKDKQILKLNKQIYKLLSKNLANVNQFPSSDGDSRWSCWRIIKKILPQLVLLQDQFVNANFINMLLDHISDMYYDISQSRLIKDHLNTLKKIDNQIRKIFNDKEKILKSEIWRQLHWISLKQYEGLIKNVRISSCIFICFCVDYVLECWQIDFL